MALAPAVAAALTDHSSRAYGLYIDGLDVIKQPGGGYGVAIETMSVDEVGPGGTSSMSFIIDDPAKAIQITDGMAVRLADLAHDVPLFLGWIQNWSLSPDFGGQGRRIQVTAVGVEALLDWCVLSYDVLVTGSTAYTLTVDAVQRLVAAAVVTGPLRVLSDYNVSSQAFPSGPPYSLAAVLVSDHLIPAGTTLREAIRICLDDACAFLAGTGLTGGCTVDFYGGLRTFMLNDPGRLPSDYTMLAISDTVGGAITAAGLEHTIDAGAITRGVYVIGGNAAGSGLVSDGTGKIGPVAVISDNTILTSAARDAAGGAYLAGFGASVRGRFDLADFTPATTIHAGTIVTLVDSQAGLGTDVRVIGEIVKTFTGLRQSWTVNYGGLSPSAMRSVRRLTRSTLS
jgi:hypothetical protein